MFSFLGTFQVFSPDADVTAPNVRGTYHQSEAVPIDLISHSRPAAFLVGSRRRELAMEDIMIHDSVYFKTTGSGTSAEWSYGDMEIWRYGDTVRAKAVLSHSHSPHHY